MILSLVSQHASSFIPKTRLTSFPPPLHTLSKPEYINLSYIELLAVCESTAIDITKEMALAVEEATRQQSTCRLWYTYPSGRITASKMKQVCHTNPSIPAQSLIKTLCYPEAYKFTTQAIRWGCNHEKAACGHYKEIMQRNHHDVSVNESGLVINPLWPHLGATPDGVVTCTCCGKGVLEIKCPFCNHNEAVEAVATGSNSCLLTSQDGTLYLDKRHMYYYQIQTQIFVCDVEYCDFCLCTFPTEGTPSIHHERIYPDKELWVSCVDKATHFFKTSILLELLGKWYTRPAVIDLRNQSETHDQVDTPSASTSSTTPILYCYCRQPEDNSSEMIECDNKLCENQWFHLHCLKMKRKDIPKGRWYCPDCRKLPQFKRRKRISDE